MGPAIFAYGTLQIPEVMQAVTGRTLIGRSAILPGYGCYCLRGRVYPGITREIGSTVHGSLYVEVYQDTLDLLDAFEDSMYERFEVEVTAGDAVLPAQAYVIREAYRQILSRRPWDIEKFQGKHLDRYLRGCHRFYNGYNLVKK
jgi:gamma-glutamylcyclotransferase (GGCT)/AIG2-like uncharacterized protein YtfP